MSNDTAIVRTFKLWAKISMMVVDGKRDAKEVADVLQTILDGGPKKASEEFYLRRLETAILAPTKGTVTIAKASDVFTGYIDSNFKNLGTDVASSDTVETSLDIHEIKKSGTSRTLFSSLGADMRSLCLTQGQIVEFCCKHPHLLRQHGYATLFLFEVKGKLFVANVHVFSDERRVLVDPIDDEVEWSAVNRLRLVVRQQTI